MDLEVLLAHLGGTIYPEEYRGDLDAVLRTFNSLEEQYRGKSPEHQAQLILFKCMLDLQSGNFATTESYMADLVSKVQAKHIAPSWLWRASALLDHKSSLQRYPPVLGFRHELGSINSIFWDEMWDVVATHQKRYDFLKSNHNIAFTTTNIWEHKLVTSTWCFSRFLATHAVVWHEEFPRGQYHAMSQHYDPVPLDRMRQSLDRMAAEATSMGLVCVTHLLERFCLDIELVTPTNSSLVSLDQYEARLSQRHDLAGLALFKMKRADLALSPPFTNPVALNLVAVDSSDAGFLNQTWDVTEDRLVLHAKPMTRLLYEEAQALFVKSGCPRGHAAVCLRLACVDFAQVMDSVHLDDEQQQLLMRVSERLDLASHLFGIDAANVQIVKVHQVLVNLMQRKWGIARRIADEIGTWGAQARNPVTSHFLGMLLIRAGRRRWLRADDTDFAVNCFQCAATLFFGMGDTLSEMKALVAQCQIHDSTMNDTALLELVGLVRARLAVTWKLFDEVISKHQGSTIATTLLLAKQNLLVTMAPLLSRVYTRSGDINAAETWYKDLENLYSNDNMRVAAQSAFQSEYNKASYLEQWGTSLTPNLIDQARHDERMANEVSSILKVYRQQLQNFDIDNANTQLEHFVSQLAQRYRSSSYMPLAAAYLYYVMGCKDQILSLLNILPNRSPTSDVRRFVEYENQVAVRVMAQDWQNGRDYMDAVIALNPEFLDAGQHQGNETWNRFLWAGLINEHTGKLVSAFSCFLVARSKLERRRSRTSDDDARLTSLSTANAGEVYQALGRICLVAASSKIPINVLTVEYVHLQHPPTSWIDAAIAFIEDGRARTLYDALQEDLSAGPYVKKDFQTAYQQRLRRHLHSIPKSLRTEREIEELVALDISVNQQVTNDESYELESKPEHSMTDFYPLILPDEVVLSLSFGMNAYTVILITKTGIDCVKLSNVQDVDVRRSAFRLMKLLSDTSMLTSARRHERIAELVQGISDMVIKPVAEYIRHKKHLTFIASTPLNAFPFGMLQMDGKALVEQMSISSAPSLRVLHHLIRKRMPIQQPRIQVIVKPGKLDREACPEEPPLPLAGIEGILIARLFRTWPIDAANITRQGFRQALHNTDILHIGTHGYLHAQAPLLSSISLQERFRVLEMIFNQNEVKVCVFSACVSGLGHTTSSNDVLGFSHAVLSSGCSTFIGALWKINDVAAMLLMFFFYHRLARKSADVSMASLLREAQMELKSLTMEAAHGIIDQLIATWDEAESAGLEPNKLVRKGKKILQLKKRIGLGELDFSDPSHWSAFLIFGDGNLA